MEKSLSLKEGSDITIYLGDYKKSLSLRRQMVEWYLSRKDHKQRADVTRAVVTALKILPSTFHSWVKAYKEEKNATE